MSLTIKEVLDNAQYNLINNRHLGHIAALIGLEQLNNANNLLNAGYKLDDDFDEAFENYKSLNNK